MTPIAQPLIPKSDDEIISALRAQLERQHQQGATLQGQHEHSQLFLAAINQSPEAIFFTDESGHILYVNETFLVRSGYSREEIIGKTPRILKSGSHPPEFYQDMWKTLMNGDVFRSRIINQAKSGELMFEELSISPVRDAKNVITNFVAIKSDIRQLVEHERRLERTNIELRRTNAELEEFAYAASHDLQEPLRSISSCLQLVKKRAHGRIDEKTNTFIDHAVQAAVRMRSLIEALLSLSKVNKVRGEQPQPTDLNPLVETACKNLEEAIKTTGASIHIETLPRATVHANLLVQVFQNLIGNAIKFRGSDAPVIEVGALPLRNGGWRIHIGDNGIGIKNEHFQQVFQMFKRLHRKEDYPGTGIGLAICKKIVEKHGGTIGVESAPGVGTTFYFTLPSPSTETVSAQNPTQT